MEIKLDKQCRGTRILYGDEVKERRELLNQMVDILVKHGFSEIILPTIEPTEIYTDKAGKEIENQMYIFNDKKERSLCLRPEGTATCQLLANTQFKYQKNVKLFYFERCYRYEKPQLGRYREFYQLGVEILNPTDLQGTQLMYLAEELISLRTNNYVINKTVKRGLSYYTKEGFEISCPELGAQQQVCGGGPYKEGIGFAIGFDRLMLCKSTLYKKSTILQKIKKYIHALWKN